MVAFMLLVLWLTIVAEGITLLAAAVVLIRHRHRSRRATGRALVAVSGLAGNWLLGLGLMATQGWWKDSLSDDNFLVAVEVRILFGRLWWLACLLLLVSAVVADRQRIKLSGAEADYRDPPAD